MTPDVSPGVPALNATPVQAGPVAAGAVTGAPLGIAHIEQILDVGVSAFDAYKTLQPADSTWVKVSKFLPVLMSGIGALDQIGKAGPEFQDIDASEIKTLADKYVPRLGITSPKTSVYVQEGLSIVISAFKIFKAK